MNLFILVTAAALTVVALPACSTEREISTISGGSHLAGVLDVADARNAPVVLVIPGSGPTDRDGNNPLGVKAQPYKLLAAALNAKGITVARIDKRGMFASKDPDVDPNAVTLSKYADDVAAWVETLRDETHAPCIWLLGHSEGSQVAEVAAISTRHLCGLVLVSAPSESADALLRHQLHDRLVQTPQASVLPALDRTIADLKQGQHVDVSGLPAFAQSLFRPTVQNFLIDLFAHNPAADLRKSRGPVLVIEGSHDHQVAASEGDGLKNARPDVQLTIIDGMNHVWKNAPADLEGDMRTYGNPGLSISHQFTDTIASFLRKGASEGHPSDK